MADLDKKDRELIRELYRLLDKRSRLCRGGAKKVLGMDPTGCVQPLRCVSALGTRVGAAAAVNSRVHDLGHCSRAVQKLFEQSAAPPIAIQYIPLDLLTARLSNMLSNLMNRPHWSPVLEIASPTRCLL